MEEALRTAMASPSDRLEQEREKLRQLCGSERERRSSERWGVELPVESWLQLEDSEGGLRSKRIPVELIDLSAIGVAVRLTRGPDLRQGQRGLLISQSPDTEAGLQWVRCCWLRRQGEQIEAGLAFEPAAAGP